MPWEPEGPDSPTEGYNPDPPGGWTCFHCSERFADAFSAQRHFGNDTIEGRPACFGHGETLKNIKREAERMGEALGEDNPLRDHLVLIYWYAEEGLRQEEKSCAS